MPQARLVPTDLSGKLPIDMFVVAELLQEHCRRYILPLYNNLTPQQVRKKGERGDVVTEADEAMERHMSTTLKDYLPHSKVFGEEGYGRFPASAEVLKGSDYIWVIDPLDGTRNFMHGRVEFCSMLALIKDGETLAAWIYLPLEERFLMADKYGGAYDDSRTMICIDEQSLGALLPADMVGQINFGLFGEARGESREGREALAHSTYKKLDRLFCAGYDFAGMCLQRRHFSVYRRLWWWDHIAGVFILRQAGGTAYLLDGGAYSPRLPACGLVAAVSRPIAEKLCAFMLEGQKSCLGENLN